MTSKKLYDFVENIFKISLRHKVQKPYLCTKVISLMSLKNKKRNLVILLCILVGIFYVPYVGILYFKHNNEKYYNKVFSQCDHKKYANIPISPSNKLNDKNEIHLLHAQTNGLKKTFQTNAEFFSCIDSLRQHAILVEVTENRFYQLKPLTHSLPYLIPETVDMLNEIGYRFQQMLAEKKFKNYRFRITSMLRTEEEQGKLSHRNRNATEHSAHLYGTTVDISYKDFYNTKADTIESSYEAAQTLTKVLIEMRQECKLLAVREHKQSCFHLTVVLCKPNINVK